MPSEKQIEAAMDATHGNIPVTLLVRALTAAEQAEPALGRAAGTVKVKALEWRPTLSKGRFLADGPLVGRYIADEFPGGGKPGWLIVGPDDDWRLTDTIEAAKAAAQADYERRVLAALEPAEPASSGHYYPIPMPLDADGKGPASFEEGEVRKLVFEVWDQDFRSHGTFDNLPEAIAHANKLNAFATQAETAPAPEPVLDVHLIHKIPSEIIDAARRVELFFRNQNIKDWKLLGIQSRSSTHPSPSEARLREALERVPDEAGHWAYVYCRVHIGSEYEDEISEFVTQKVRSFVERASLEAHNAGGKDAE